MKNPLWGRLPAEMRSRVDGLIADDSKLQAIVAIRSMLDEPRPGIFECMEQLAEQYAELEEPWFRPSPRLNLDGLIEQTAALPRVPSRVRGQSDLLLRRRCKGSHQRMVAAPSNVDQIRRSKVANGYI